jgi:hypothetical protein
MLEQLKDSNNKDSKNIESKGAGKKDFKSFLK